MKSQGQVEVCTMYVCMEVWEMGMGEKRENQCESRMPFSHLSLIHVHVEVCLLVPILHSICPCSM